MIYKVQSSDGPLPLSVGVDEGLAYAREGKPCYLALEDETGKDADVAILVGPREIIDVLADTLDKILGKEPNSF